MLIEFTVGNYLSFKEKVTFSMEATQTIDEISSLNTSLDLDWKTELNHNNVFKIDDQLSLLKSAAIYGANASGKTNLIKAISFMDRFIRDSSKNTQVKDLIDVEEFRLSTETIRKPCFFEIVFWVEKKIYRYGFEVTKKEVISEWLYYTPTKKEYKLFTRKAQEFDINKGFKEGETLKDKTRRNALFLSVNAQFNGKISQKLLNWFDDLSTISGIHGHLPNSFTVSLLKEKKFKSDIINFMQKFDLSIDDIQVIEREIPSDFLPKEILEELSQRAVRGTIVTFDIITRHRQYDSKNRFFATEDFDMESHESEGTKKIFAFAAPLLTSLKEGSVLIIDELDARLHPMLVKSIIDLFNSNDTNPKNAQLIFTTHNTNLLSNKIFRKDQIWFTEKNQYEVTDLYSLVEYSNISKEASFENDYIKGKYGAIPYIGNLKDLV
ncbi:MAG: AAA family ATPase [Waterburya sp.]